MRSPFGFARSSSSARQQARILEERAVKRARAAIPDGDWPFLFQVIIARCDLDELGLRFLDPIVGAERALSISDHVKSRRAISFRALRSRSRFPDRTGP